MMHNVGKAINEAFDKEDWEVARRRILAALEEEPRHHWLLSKLSAVYYEERDYQKALSYAKKAQQIAPECPLVLWDLAGALLATGHVQSALAIYRKLMTEGVAKASACPHGEGEGPAWAVCLLIDSLFMAGVCQQRLGHKRPAISNFITFLQVRDDWDGCINSREDAIKRIVEIERSRGQHVNGFVQEIEKEKAREALSA
jgi:tetratricopeptide (TPR) repeat protein